MRFTSTIVPCVHHSRHSHNQRKTLIRFTAMLTVLGLAFAPALGQNFDLQRNSTITRFGGTAGASLSGTADLYVIDSNPAGLASLKHATLSLAQRIRHFDYSLDNLFQNHSVMNYRWSNLLYDFDHALFALPVSHAITIGGGILQKFDGSISNQYTAVTRSVLFNHELRSHVYALTASLSARVADDLSIGVTLYRYDGSFRSTVEGDRHGLDSDKWATLISRCSGYSLRCGIQFSIPKFSFGAAIESACPLDITTEKTISPDQRYEYLFPTYEQTSWRMPSILTAGCSYRINEQLLTSVDVSTQTYQTSGLTLPLYEYAGGPSWGTITSLRAGIEIVPFDAAPVWLRFGYARIPQVYSNQHALARDVAGILVVDSYANSSRLMKQMLSLDVRIAYASIILQPGIEYSTIDWNRTITGSTLLRNTSHEKNTNFSLLLVYSLLP